MQRLRSHVSFGFDVPPPPGEISLSGGCIAVSAAFTSGCLLALAVVLGCAWRGVEMDAGVILLASMPLEICLILAAVIAPLVERASLRNALALHAVPLLCLPAAVVGTLAVSMFGDRLAQAVADVTHWHYGSIEQISALLRATSGPARLAAVVGIAVLPALGEEFVCRGLLFRACEVKWGGRVAVLLTAIFFAALHMDPVQGASAFILGLYCGEMRRRTGSIVPGMLGHCANNLLYSLIVLNASLEHVLARETWPLVLLGLLVAGACLLAMRERER
jgi:membrane protease YdiL (CAAX protease family)